MKKNNEWRWGFKLGRFEFKFVWRSRHGFGRFGGGWNWCIGVEVGGSTVILNCLVFYLRFNWRSRETSEV